MVNCSLFCSDAFIVPESVNQLKVGRLPKFAQELKETNQCIEFTLIREQFEEFLVRHKHYINDLSHGKGGRMRPLESFMTMYRIVMKAMKGGIRDDKEIETLLNADPGLQGHLKDDEPESEETRKKFSKAAIAAAAVREKLATRGRCPICKARLPEYARSKEHKTDQKHGGRGTADNLSFTHAYCNNSKDGLKQAGLSL